MIQQHEGTTEPGLMACTKKVPGGSESLASAVSRVESLADGDVCFASPKSGADYSDQLNDMVPRSSRDLQSRLTRSVRSDVSGQFPRGAHSIQSNALLGSADKPELEVEGDYTLSGGAASQSQTSHNTTDLNERKQSDEFSLSNLPPLQPKQPDTADVDTWDPLATDDPASFDLVAPPQLPETAGTYKLEQRAKQLFGEEHLHAIFNDSQLLLKFTSFLNSHRPQSVPVLVYYLNALKAIRAIHYSNAVAELLSPVPRHSFADTTPQHIRNTALEEKANKAFTVLVRDELPAYITHEWAAIVRVQIERRINGTLAPHLLEASEGLGEVFCLTDPARPDNPIVFSTHSFSTVTQYGMNYAIGRNCRFLQGPKTSPSSVQRLSEACKRGLPVTEVFLNYHRDGSPFMNMLTIAPLKDSSGRVKYFLGSQIEVSGLARNCTNLDGLARLVVRQQDPQATHEVGSQSEHDALTELCKMFNNVELEEVRRAGGSIYRNYAKNDAPDIPSAAQSMRRVVLSEPSQDMLDEERRHSEDPLGLPNSSPIAPSGLDSEFGKVENIYRNWLLIRPAPSLRILFTSPSLRIPGVSQSEFLWRIGGSDRVRAGLRHALSEGRSVTAKIRWLARPDENGEGDGRPRWIHCTPLLGHNGEVGAWMVILVDDESTGARKDTRFRVAPIVSAKIDVGERATKLRQGFGVR